jgi:hypothetical protein
MAESFFARDGANVRMVHRENEPTLFSIHDTIVFVRGINNVAARKVYSRLVGDHPELYDSYFILCKLKGNSKRVPMTTYKGLLAIFQVMGGHQAKLFRLQCVDTLHDNLFPITNDENQTQSLLNMIKDFSDVKPRRRDENIVVQHLAHAIIGSSVEVKCTNGFCDITTPKLVIEVKTVDAWKHALGQILAYVKDFEDLRPCLHLFGSKDALKKYLPRAKQCCKHYHVYVSWNIVTTTDDNKVDVDANSLSNATLKLDKIMNKRQYFNKIRRLKKKLRKDKLEIKRQLKGL